MRTHVDIFSGIGGFALAAAANGIETVALCEIDERCRVFLGKAWPRADIHEDVRTFDGTKYRGAYLLTAGTPCQPASRAGRRMGAKDDRWLWPAAVRVLSGIRPTWALFENPPGLGDVELAGVLSDVAAQGYSVRVFSVPACAVGAPHIRERFWIVGHAEGQPREVDDGEERKKDSHARRTDSGSVADAERERRQGRRNGPAESHRPRPPAPAAGGGFWGDYVRMPCADGKTRRAPGSSFDVVDGVRPGLLAALGNSIVPQVAEVMIRIMIEADEEPAEWAEPGKE